MAYKVLIQRTRIIEESFDVKFDDFNVRKTAPLNEIKFTMENDIHIQFGPLNIIEVNYDTPEMARRSEVLLSPSA